MDVCLLWLLAGVRLSGAALAGGSDTFAMVMMMMMVCRQEEHKKESKSRDPFFAGIIIYTIAWIKAPCLLCVCTVDVCLVERNF